jgi:hypothetical protein
MKNAADAAALLKEKQDLEQACILIAKDIAHASLTQEVFARQIQSISQCAWVGDASEKIVVLQKLHEDSQNVVAALFKAMEEAVTKLAALNKK